MGLAHGLNPSLSTVVISLSRNVKEITLLISGKTMVHTSKCVLEEIAKTKKEEEIEEIKRVKLNLIA